MYYSSRHMPSAHTYSRSVLALRRVAGFQVFLATALCDEFAHHLPDLSSESTRLRPLVQQARSERRSFHVSDIRCNVAITKHLRHDGSSNLQLHTLVISDGQLAQYLASCAGYEQCVA